MSGRKLWILPLSLQLHFRKCLAQSCKTAYFCWNPLPFGVGGRWHFHGTAQSGFAELAKRGGSRGGERSCFLTTLPAAAAAGDLGCTVDLEQPPPGERTGGLSGPHWNLRVQSPEESPIPSHHLKTVRQSYLLAIRRRSVLPATQGLSGNYILQPTKIVMRIAPILYHTLIVWNKLDTRQSQIGNPGIVSRFQMCFVCSR